MIYIVGTPIGNLQDMTLRAIEVLKNVDVILCEDTRQTRKLVEKFELKKKLISLHQHSSEEKIERLIAEYEDIAYVSDAGTPGISDPGGKLVQLAIEAGYEVCPIPGPSAVASALSISGYPTDKFLFLGFMPRKGQQKTLDLMKNSKYTVCFYESPHRIIKTLEKLKTELEEDRQIVVARELTKKFETIYRGTAEEILEQVKEKGEFTVVISPKK
ncbi:16S rRNA (cytidine(1402)-2'-O)-methyltransferase [Candidatus Falkowbacteria bacterium]|jgi:16S rRNA (cytidine1402-2'-O)-methyltransferase|nr:16S rRNA (cytidine(1402)-2'-O)-methyltransferase [Candidatus Falkowbacteria bacterium]MBT6574070.1 16S rRNA (cytidine(1402)-2'-O)-methyltransferase [Candidatus Falkowbacteria bacterium]MBT7348228.1 16S rRNA (cytidine(1402)-2'-O)-methyltransferase [Candidatus Falkowbacteria bacterium]MBT7500207.1 16S rRNA (cytidine(1402)-2'-O)-methyltransferase [Candidatus Falkowbacteria bacterium]